MMNPPPKWFTQTIPRLHPFKTLSEASMKNSSFLLFIHKMGQL